MGKWNLESKGKALLEADPQTDFETTDEKTILALVGKMERGSEKINGVHGAGPLWKGNPVGEGTASQCSVSLCTLPGEQKQLL